MILDVQRNSGETDDAILGRLLTTAAKEEVEFLTSHEDDEVRLDAKQYSLEGNKAFAQHYKVGKRCLEAGFRFGDGKDELKNMSKAKSKITEHEKILKKVDEQRKLERAIESQLQAQGLKPGTEEFDNAFNAKMVALDGGKVDEPKAGDAPVEDFITREVAKLEAVLRAMHSEAGASEEQVINMVDGQIDMWRRNVATSLLAIGKKSGFIETDDCYVKMAG
jgi:hypothetical protein